ncbi:uncharacterized protein BDZ99DRAFT_557860, partial [Mytilinidion resinicola]
MTQDTSPLMTRRYSAPELLEDAPRSSAADLWSLGCVYLEMCTILNGKSISAMRDHLQGFGSKSAIDAKNKDGAFTWVNQLSGKAKSPTDLVPLRWIKDLLAKVPTTRPLGRDLLSTILKSTDAD